MPNKPHGLQITSLVCMALGAGLALALLLAPLDMPWYSVNDHTMKGRAFVRAFGIPSALVAITLFGSGWGVFRDKLWSRPALLVAMATFWGSGAWFDAYFAGTGVLLGYLWRGVFLLLFGAAILYGLPSVKRYYDALR